KKIRTLKREKKSNQQNFDKEEKQEQDLNESANTSARKEPEISESVVEFVVISNSATMEDLDLLF
ncbi:12651_t:CDS:2, partial [Gigaspora rosea]